jgi:hypothetical protein
MANKKKKYVDLKPKVEKVNEEELKSIQDLVSIINKAQMQIGAFELQKNEAVQTVIHFKAKLNELQIELEKKYGKVSVNLNDGTIKPDQNESNKKN